MTWTEYNKVNLWGCSSTWCCTSPLPLPHRSAMTPVCPVHQHHSHVSIHYDHNVPLLSMYLVVLLISNTSWNVSMKYYIYVQFSIVKHVVLVLIHTPHVLHTFIFIAQHLVYEHVHITHFCNPMKCAIHHVYITSPMLHSLPVITQNPSSLSSLECLYYFTSIYIYCSTTLISNTLRVLVLPDSWCHDMAHFRNHIKCTI